MHHMKTFLLCLALVGASFGQNSAKYPNSIVSQADLGIATNLAETTLLLGINSTATTLSVASGAQFRPGSYVSIDNEIVAICGVSGNTLTVGLSSCPNVDGRGLDQANGAGAAVAHLAGRPVQSRITAWHHNQAAAEILALEQNSLPKNGNGSQLASDNLGLSAGNSTIPFFMQATTTLSANSIATDSQRLFNVFSQVLQGTDAVPYHLNKPDAAGNSKVAGAFFSLRGANQFGNATGLNPLAQIQNHNFNIVSTSVTGNVLTIVTEVPHDFPVDPRSKVIPAGLRGVSCTGTSAFFNNRILTIASAPTPTSITVNLTGANVHSDYAPCDEAVAIAYGYTGSAMGMELDVNNFSDDSVAIGTDGLVIASGWYGKPWRGLVVAATEADGRGGNVWRYGIDVHHFTEYGMKIGDARVDPNDRGSAGHPINLYLSGNADTENTLYIDGMAKDAIKIRPVDDTETTMVFGTNSDNTAVNWQIGKNGWIALGTHPASYGAVRLSPGKCVTARNAGYTDDVNLVCHDSATDDIITPPIKTPYVLFQGLDSEKTTYAPRMANNCYIANITGVGSWCQMLYTEKPVTITRLSVFQSVAPAGCSTWPVVSLYDNTGSAILTSVTEANTQTVDSGAIAVEVPAGKQIITRVTTGPTGCSPNASVATVTMQWKMQ